MRILIVALADSVHTARWISLFNELNWDIHLFPARASSIHPDFSQITVHDFWRARPHDLDSTLKWSSRIPLRKGSATARRLTAGLPWLNNARLLARLVQRIQPDIVHSLEMQHAAYLTLEAKQQSKLFPPWIVTNWGSDIFYFRQFAAHAAKIREVLEACDYYTCECERDIRLAEEFGFRGRSLRFQSNAGGYEIALSRSLQQPGPVAARRWILLKGYQGWTGRALCGLEAIANCADIIRARDFKIGIYIAEPGVRQAALEMKETLRLPITIIESCPHEEMLRWHGRARVSIGLSLSDGASTSFLEALLMGSFPIQSNTACAEEWVTEGRTGMIVPPEDAPAITMALHRALTDDALIESAYQVNQETSAVRLNRHHITEQAVAMYEEIAPRR